jgi:oligoribonuclease NrnB/cAMP/cGMP phosphodiesterase (DHH superfamily)
MGFKMKILSISHYDLDGFGCQLCIYEKFKKHNIDYDNCGYGKIEKTLEKYDFNNYDLVFITDLNFNKNQQKLLYNKLQNYNGKCIYIDHHQYETTEWLEKSNLKLIIDTSKSATLKTFEILKLENKNLKKLCEIIDIYDMWRTDNPKFKLANYFNSWFWENNQKFRPLMKNINYDISQIKNELKKVKQNVEKFFKENINKKIFYNKNVLISFDYGYSNHIYEFFPDTKFAVFVNLNQNRISIKDNLSLKEKVKKIAEKYNGECGGHIEAYGMVIPDLQNKYQNILKDLTNLIDK